MITFTISIILLLLKYLPKPFRTIFSLGIYRNIILEKSREI